jgi:hypothetical protein
VYSSNIGDDRNSYKLLVRKHEGNIFMHEFCVLDINMFHFHLQHKKLNPKSKTDQTTSELVRSGAAALFGAMSSDWFGSS